MQNDYKSVSIEGLIGSGKSTILNHIRGFATTVEIVPEPVDEFCDIHGENLLQMMYQDPRKWGFAFQNHVLNLLTRLQAEKPKASKTRLRLLERSIHSGRFVFTEAFLKNGFIRPIEYQVIIDRYNLINEYLQGVKLDGIIYAQCSPEVCLERIIKRGRKEEEEITLPYLKDLRDFHENWLFGTTPQNVFIINTEGTLDEVTKQTYDLIANLL